MSLKNQRLYKFYLENVCPQLKKQFNIQNVYQLPKVDKIIVNQGLGELAQNPKVLNDFLTELAVITGQYGVITKAKKSIATFKIRQGMEVGISLTLRGEKMYAFLDRLINLSLPRIRDFQGINHKSFDGKGNYNLGLKDQLMFPEISFDSVKQVQGMDIAIVTTAKNDEVGYQLLSLLGMPFNKPN